jgi:hypothetical protein
MSWIYKGKEFTKDMIPENAIGFIYNMTAIIDGKSISYIGKKNFWAYPKTNLAKKDMPTDKRLKTYVRKKRNAYKNYYSSNEVLKKAHKDNVKIKRDILMICYSATELTYQEVKHQFKYEVLEKEEFLNGNILGKFFKFK